jgi:solute carrier family 50 protein (sugar transporter)
MATIMFASPLVDLQKAVHHGDIGKLNPTPWAFMLGNCFGWLTYGILVGNLWIFFTNIPGFLISIWLNFGAVKLLYQRHHSNEMTRCILKVLLDHERKMLLNYAASLEGAKDENQSYQQLSSSPTCVTTKVIHHPEEEEDEYVEEDEDLVLNEKKKQLQVNSENQQSCSSTYGATADIVDLRIQPVVEWSKMLLDVTSQKSPAPAPHEKLVLLIATIWVLCISIIFLVPSITPKTREYVVASLVNLNLVFFYGAPLSTIYEVIRERSSSSIHVPTMIANTLSSLFWAAYGVAVMDLFVAVPNGLGSFFGVSQIILYFYFPRSLPQEQFVVVETATASSSVQLKEENLELVEEGLIRLAGQ